MVKSRWNINKILSIQNASGDWVRGQQVVETVAINYFKELFNPNMLPHYNGIDDYSPLLSKHISSSQASFLTAPITDEEVLKVLKSMKKNKSPGPDVLNVNLFNIIGTLLVLIFPML